MDYPIEIWNNIVLFLDTKTINNTLLVLAYHGVDTKSILEKYISDILKKYKIVIEMYNRLDSIINRKEYIRYYSKMYNIKYKNYITPLFYEVYLHIIKLLDKEDERKRKFKHIVGKVDIKLIYNPYKTKDIYMKKFIKCIGHK
jgi:hypothetical protein